MLKSAPTQFLSPLYRYLVALASARIAVSALSALLVIPTLPTTCYSGLAASLISPPSPPERSLVLTRMCVREVKSVKERTWATLWKQKRHEWDAAPRPTTSLTLATPTSALASTWVQARLRAITMAPTST